MKFTMPWKDEARQPHGLMGNVDEVRHALRKEADHLAQVAAQLGRDATHEASKTTSDVGAQAASAARDTTAAAAGLVQQALRGVGQIGGQIAETGRKSVADLGQDVQSVGQDLRRVRVTTEPRKTGPDMMPGIALLGGFGAGIALLYFLDPEQGKRRRALLRDQFTKWTRISRETAEGKAKDVRNRTIGVMHEARKAVAGVAGNESSDADTSTYESTPSGAGNGYGYGEQTSEQTSDREAPVIS